MALNIPNNLISMISLGHSTIPMFPTLGVLDASYELALLDYQFAFEIVPAQTPMFLTLGVGT